MPKELSLPLPVTHPSSDPPHTRFVPPSTRAALRASWARLVRRISVSAPEESLVGEPTAEEASDHGSLRLNVTQDGKKEGGSAEEDPETGVVDEVVVDNPADFEDWGLKVPQISGDGGSVSGGGEKRSSPGTVMQHRSDTSSHRETARETHGALGGIKNFCRGRVYPLLQHFFCPAYPDSSLEKAYQKEIWATQKSVCIFGACFMVLNWILTFALFPRPWNIQIQYYALEAAFCAPLVPMAIFDWPRRRPRIWQLWVFAAVWIPAIGNIIDMSMCHYFVPSLKSCGTKTFQSALFYASAFPVVGLFALGQTRAISMFGCVCWVLMVALRIIPHKTSYVKHVVNVVLFQAFVLFAQYRRVISDRRMWTMRAELEVQFRAKEQAQISERKTMDSNRRFSSYIFHEVRVPLNTALLAVQNLLGTDAFSQDSDQAIEYAALKGSLQMMSQVLNDVLDFTRMERGGFSSVSLPFSFHGVLRSIFVPLRLDANARGLLLETSLDPLIDEVIHRLASVDDNEANLSVGEGDGLVMGDEMRLRQILHNLASNACKFTPAGGKISIRTTLIYPRASETLATAMAHASADDIREERSGSTHSPRLDERSNKRDVVVVRVEVQDTGVGIKRKDMTDSHLFSPYVQTEIGKHQGGKGTGLGLSLVRQIVMLTGGRLGLKSKFGEGSTFWVEIPFQCGPQVFNFDPAESHRRVSSLPKDVLPTAASDRADLRFLPALRSSPVQHSYNTEYSTPPIDTTELSRTIPRSSPRPATPVTSVAASGAPSPDDASYLDPSAKRPRSLSSNLAPPVTTKTKSRPLVFEDGPLRVLVVDDDTLTRCLMGRMMERLGCKVSMAENGAVALKMILEPPGGTEEEVRPGVDPRSGAAEKSYDMVFLDNQMPVLSGPEMVRKLRALARDDLVIAITANAQLSEQESFVTAGASSVLTKPVLEADLRRYLIIADQQRTLRKQKVLLPETFNAVVGLNAEP